MEQIEAGPKAQMNQPPFSPYVQVELLREHQTRVLQQTFFGRLELWRYRDWTWIGEFHHRYIQRSCQVLSSRLHP